MYRLESMLTFLRSKGWLITESESKTLVAYNCTKVNTTMEIAFVDSMAHTLKRKDENGKIAAVKIKDVKVDKKTTMPRKEDMIRDLMALTKQRIDIIYAVSDESPEFKMYLKTLGFEVIMKDINEEKFLKLYCQSKSFGAFKPESKPETLMLNNFKGMFTQAGSCNGEEIDKKYESIICQAIFSDKDLEFICMYLEIVKAYYEVENEDYGGIYENEIAEAEKLLVLFSSFCE